MATVHDASRQRWLYADLDEREASILAQFLALPSASATAAGPDERVTPLLRGCIDAMHSVGFVEREACSDGTVAWRVTPKGVLLFRLLYRLQTET